MSNNKYLKPCVVCGKDVSINASKCVHCGEGAPRVSLKTKKNLTIAALVIMMLPIFFFFYAQYKIKEMFSSLQFPNTQIIKTSK